MYGFLYVTDREEGLIVVGNQDPKSRNMIGVGTLLDGNPANNFLERAATFNPDGVLTGARRITIAGTYAYILTRRGTSSSSRSSDPLAPEGHRDARRGRRIWTIRAASQVQFRYGFVVDQRRAEGARRHVARPAAPIVRAPSCRSRTRATSTSARTYAFVAAGHDGLGIVDIEKPEQPALEQMFNDGGKINDTNDVKIGMTNASLFALPRRRPQRPAGRAAVLAGGQPEPSTASARSRRRC